MKVFVITLGLAVLLCCLFSSAEAASERQKRSVARENCPKNKTSEECQAYAKEQSKSHKYCHRYIIAGGARPTIEWQSCGSVFCGDNTRKVPENLSKPYPDCCARCEIVDDSKPAVESAVG